MNCNFSFSLEALIFLLWLLKLHKCIKKLVLKCPPPRTISARLSIWIILLWKYCSVKPKSKPVIVSFAATNSYLEVHAKNLELRRLDFRTLTNCARTVLSALLGFSTFCSPLFFHCMTEISITFIYFSTLWSIQSHCHSAVCIMLNQIRSHGILFY